MREAAFIKQNKERWLAAEQMAKSSQNIAPDRLAQTYVDILNDLAFSQTYYPKNSTTLYLNSLTRQIYRKIYKTQRLDYNFLSVFFLHRVPRALYAQRKVIYFAFALFAFFVFLGVLSARNDPDYVRVILGNSYVNMTLENIKKGDPMAVYASHSNWGSSIGITINNIKVATLCFLGGFFAGVYTFMAGLQNAFMVGAFQYFFYEKEAFALSLRAIWLHGAMEIFSIVICMAAGFVFAKSLLFAGNYPRLVSLKRGFRQGFVIFVATLPFFMVAGFIEGFITRYYMRMPLWLNLLIIFGTLFFIAYYFLVYPIIYNKRNH